MSVRPRFLDAVIWTALLVVLLATLSGCSGPCQSLADEICSCEPNARTRDACEQQVDAVKDSPVSPEEEQVCDALLQTCDCNALEAGRFELCGLSKQLQ